jgi:hypothetical protein
MTMGLLKHCSPGRTYGYYQLLKEVNDAKAVGIHCEGRGHVCSFVCLGGCLLGAMATGAPHSPKSLEHICSMRPSALCSISHWAQILVTEERSQSGWEGDAW